MTNIKAISIPEPCHQSWQQMTVNDEGRHCAHCCKTVVDFTKMSDAQVIEYLTAKTNVCGRLEQYQLTHINNTLSAKNLKAGWWKRALVVLSLLGPASFKVSAQSKPAMVKTSETKGKLKLSNHKSGKKPGQPRRFNILEVRSIGYIPKQTSVDTGRIKLNPIVNETTQNVVMGGAIAVSIVAVPQPRFFWIRVRGIMGGVHSELLYIDNVQR